LLDTINSAAFTEPEQTGNEIYLWYLLDSWIQSFQH
jgi:hypothetical protein